MSGWTKRQLIVAAFGEIGLASYVPDLTPEQYQEALVRLDSMMATWNGLGIRLGYPLPSSQAASDLDQESNLADSANETTFQNLGVRIAPGFGKTVSPDTKVAAKLGFNSMLAVAQGLPAEKQMPGTMPSGAGNKPWRQLDSGPFLNPPEDPILAGNDSAIDFD